MGGYLFYPFKSRIKYRYIQNNIYLLWLTGHGQNDFIILFFDILVMSTSGTFLKTKSIRGLERCGWGNF
jgi:hypothetical protein